MRLIDIEAWALSVIDRVTSGQPIEDARVELKSAWIDAKKAARRIAGHANAARGEPILWLIGVNEQNGTVPGANPNDLANWWPQVKSEFEGEVPVLVDLNVVPSVGVTVVALYFETDRAPFLVKISPGSGATFEVPWRDGTSVRSASRADVIRLLYPISTLPSIEVLRALIEIGAEGARPDAGLEINVRLLTYIVPETPDPVVIPLHRCSAQFELVGAVPKLAFSSVDLSPGFYNSDSKPPAAKGKGDWPTLSATGEEIIIRAPSYVVISAAGKCSRPTADIWNVEAIVSMSLRPANSDRAISFDLLLTPSTKNRDPIPDYGHPHEWWFRVS